jgi:hypothetical protein
MVAIWLLFAVAGYFQWFVVIPAIPRSWKKFKGQRVISRFFTNYNLPA